jgi:DNA helicase-2/ATP-dependent DNA helicase PcrA
MSQGLNPSQRAAVEHGDGPLLILAGAGSGKTRVITHRIARLVQSGVPPDRILAVSFTNKAAEEMSERMVPLLGKDRTKKLWMSTFHSFGLRFLKEEKKAFKLVSKFTVFDQGDTMGVIKEILRELRRAGAARKLDPAAILARISSYKNSSLAPDAVPESDFEYDDIAREVYPEYEARMRAMGAVDFDDLVLLPVRVLSKDAAVRKAWRERFDYVMVDEFQDTSTVQLNLIRLLGNERGNVCVVGDDDQSIYGWRGAEVSNILDFDKHFAGAQVIKLEESYRSRESVVAVANAAIGRAQGRRHGKVLRAVRLGGDKVRVCVCDDAAAEAKLVAREIKEALKQGAPEIAILYRSNLQARIVEEELRVEGLQYKLVGGQQFFDRKEVKDVAAYLRLIVNPLDEVSLRRILNYPARGLGAKTVERIEAHAEAHALTFGKAFEQIAFIDGIPEASRKSGQELLGMFGRYRERFQAGGPLAPSAREMVEQLGIRADLQEAAEGGESGTMRFGNVEHLMSWLDRYEKKEARNKRSLQNFLERVTLRGDQAQEEQPASITMSTLHGAKGLEFDMVFLIGCVEGQLPHSRTTDPKVTEVYAPDVEEERRLFYVGVTRARDRLYLTRPKRRMLRGVVTELHPSRFLEGLPEEHIELYERLETKELEANEVADLGREFLQKMAARSALSQRAK